MVKKFSSEIDIVLALLVGETGETKKILKKKDLTLTRPIGLPPHTPVAQKSTDQR